MPPPFVKFPRTPHLFPAPQFEATGDRVVTPQDRDAILGANVVVEEKVDGSNMGICFDSNGSPHIQTRTRYLAETHRPGEPMRPTHPQHHIAFNWVWDRYEVLRDALGDNLIVYGEWMYARHTFHYSNLPDWFIAFDIFERSSDDPSEGTFWSSDRRDDLLSPIGISTVPQIEYGIFRKQDDFDDILNQDSFLGCNQIEGVYIRLENDGDLVHRAKIVRSEFRKRHTEQDDWSHTYVREKNELGDS